MYDYAWLCMHVFSGTLAGGIEFLLKFQNQDQFVAFEPMSEPGTGPHICSPQESERRCFFRHVPPVSLCQGLRIHPVGIHEKALFWVPNLKFACICLDAAMEFNILPWEVQPTSYVKWVWSKTWTRGGAAHDHVLFGKTCSSCVLIAGLEIW